MTFVKQTLLQTSGPSRIGVALPTGRSVLIGIEAVGENESERGATVAFQVGKDRILTHVPHSSVSKNSILATFRGEGETTNLVIRSLSSTLIVYGDFGLTPLFPGFAIVEGFLVEAATGTIQLNDDVKQLLKASSVFVGGGGLQLETPKGGPVRLVGFSSQVTVNGVLRAKTAWDSLRDGMKGVLVAGMLGLLAWLVMRRMRMFTTP